LRARRIPNAIATAVIDALRGFAASACPSTAVYAARRAPRCARRASVTAIPQNAPTDSGAAVYGRLVYDLNARMAERRLEKKPATADRKNAAWRW